MAYVAGVLIAAVIAWGGMLLLLQAIAKSGLVLIQTSDSKDGEGNDERARAIQDRQMQVTRKLWPLAVLVLIVAAVLLVID